jgi:hypothetical protein
VLLPLQLSKGGMNHVVKIHGGFLSGGVVHIDLVSEKYGYLRTSNFHRMHVHSS